MERRRLLAPGASLLAIPFALAPAAIAQTAAGGRTIPLGSFLVDIGVTAIRVTHRAEPESLPTPDDIPF